MLLGFALAARPDYLLLDEPLDGMDIPSRDIFRKMLISHMTDRQTAVISTHTVADMENLLTDVIILRPDGQVLTSVSDMLVGEKIDIRLKDGTARAAVREITEDRR